MYITFVDIEEKLKEFLTIQFLTLGIETYSANSPQDVSRFIQDKGSGYLLLNITQLSSPWLNFLVKLRQYKDEKYIKLIVISDKNDREFLQTLILLNVSGVVKINLPKEDTLKRIYEVICKNPHYHPEKRKYIRITPLEEDDITINISIPNSNTVVSAKVLNISIGGIAIRTQTPGEGRWFSNGMLIESTQMQLRRKIGQTALKIVMVKESLLGAVFIQPSDFFLNYIGKYMLDRLSDSE